jgi:hypothetical protein
LIIECAQVAYTDGRDFTLPPMDLSDIVREIGTGLFSVTERWSSHALAVELTESVSWKNLVVTPCRMIHSQYQFEIIWTSRSEVISTAYNF